MIEVLRKIKQFFEISVASFDFQRKVVETSGGELSKSKMERLHRRLLTELRKENPNVENIDFLLAKMEMLVDENKKQRFENGGVFSDSEQIIKKK
jgi:hypothetical protein